MHEALQVRTYTGRLTQSDASSAGGALLLSVLPPSCSRMTALRAIEPGGDELAAAERCTAATLQLLTSLLAVAAAMPGDAPSPLEERLILVGGRGVMGGDVISCNPPTSDWLGVQTPCTDEVLFLCRSLSTENWLWLVRKLGVNLGADEGSHPVTTGSKIFGFPGCLQKAHTTFN